MEPRNGLRALIVGAGKIAAGYDQPGSKEVLSHAHGFLSVSGFKLVGFVDKNLAQAQQAAAKWGGKAFADLGSAFAEGPIDVVTVATPDGTHAKLLKQLAAYAPRLVFCEKPLALNWQDAGEIEALYRGLPTQIQVNYLRRFVPDFRAVKQAIAEGRYGRFLVGTGYYVNGFLHNGSHMVDLLRYWLGEVEAARNLDPSKATQADPLSGDAADEEKSVLLNFVNGGQFTAHSLPGNPYWVFEMDLLFEQKRLRLLDSGFALQEYELGENPLFPETHEMLPQPMQITGLAQAMQFAMENIRDHLQQGKPLLCPMSEAVATLKVGLLR